MIMGVEMGTANQEITQLKIHYSKDFFSTSYTSSHRTSCNIFFGRCPHDKNLRRTEFELWTIERQEIGFLFTFVSPARIVTFQDRLNEYVFPVCWDVIRRVFRKGVKEVSGIKG